VDASGKTYTRSVEAMPQDEVVREIDQRVDMTTLERVLMEEGIRKFADPQRALIALVAQKREWS
jgi:transaldolase